MQEQFTTDKQLGALLGTALGDALGMPVEDFGHSHIRMYYKGIKGFQEDEKRRDLGAGQWTYRTALLLKVYAALERRGGLDEKDLRVEGRRFVPPTGDNNLPVILAPVLVLKDAEISAALLATFDPDVAAALRAQLVALRYLLSIEPQTFDREVFYEKILNVLREERAAELTGRIEAMQEQRMAFPLDLHDYLGGAGRGVRESWCFAVAMFARNPFLTEATLLSAINVGGDAPGVGAMVGSMLGALNGWSGFPEEWRTGLEATGLEMTVH